MASELGKESKGKQRTEIPYKLLRVVVDKSSLLNGLFDCGKIGVSKNHVGCELRDISSAAHCNTNIRLLQCRRIIDAIASLWFRSDVF